MRQEGVGQGSVQHVFCSLLIHAGEQQGATPHGEEQNEGPYQIQRCREQTCSLSFLSIAGGDETSSQVPSTAGVAEEDDEEVQQGPADGALAAACVEYGHICFGQSIEDAEEGVAVVAQVVDDTDEQSQTSSNLNDELNEVSPQVSHDTADSNVDQGDQASNTDTNPDGHAGEAVQQDADGGPLCSDVQQLGNDTGDSNQQLSSAVVTHHQVFGGGLDAQSLTQAGPTGNDSNGSQ